MRSLHQEHAYHPTDADEVTPRTEEDDERALERARVHTAAFEGFGYGRGGRCTSCNTKPHPERGCLCGRTR